MVRFKFLLAFFLIGAAVEGFAQDPVAQKYASVITPKLARKHIKTLASDKFEGRETGTRGADRAAAYIAKEFKKLNLTAPVNGSYFQNVPLVEAVPEVASFTVNGTNFTQGQDFVFNGSGSNSVNASEIVFIGYGISEATYDDLKDQDLAGKVVLLIVHEEPVRNGVSLLTGSSKLSEWSTHRSKRLQNVINKNPAIVLAVNPDVAGWLPAQPVKPRLTLKEASGAASRQAAPIVYITPETAQRLLSGTGQTYVGLKSSIDQSGQPQSRSIRANVGISYGPSIKDVESVNVLGYLEGSDLKDELLVFSAHYDHVGMDEDAPGDKIYNGADDDASGTSAVLEIARALVQAKKDGKGPRRSVLFLLVTGEEKGLLGSEYYAESPVFPMANTIANLNIDMIGRTGELYKNSPDSANYCYLIGSDKLSTDLHKISENANAVYTKLKIDYKYNDPNDPERIYYRSDHYNFAKHNVPIIFYFNGVHEDYHKPSDEIGKINFDLHTRRAHLIFYTGWDLLNREKRPVVDVVNNMPNTR